MKNALQTAVWTLMGWGYNDSWQPSQLRCHHTLAPYESQQSSAVRSYYLYTHSDSTHHFNPPPRHSQLGEIRPAALLFCRHLNQADRSEHAFILTLQSRLDVNLFCTNLNSTELWRCAFNLWESDHHTVYL